MKKIKFLEVPKEDVNLEKRMFPEMFNLSQDELSNIKGGKNQIEHDCDAVCSRPQWGGNSCPNYGHMA